MKMAATTSDEANALVGTWRVLEFADLDKDGKGVYLFGEHPRGLLRLRRNRARAYSDHEGSAPDAIS